MLELWGERRERRGCEGGRTGGDGRTEGPFGGGGHGSQMSARTWFGGFSSLLPLPGRRLGVGANGMEPRRRARQENLMKRDGHVS